MKIRFTLFSLCFLSSMAIARTDVNPSSVKIAECSVPSVHFAKQADFIFKVFRLVDSDVNDKANILVQFSTLHGNGVGYTDAITKVSSLVWSNNGKTLSLRMFNWFNLVITEGLHTPGEMVTDFEGTKKMTCDASLRHWLE